MKKCWNKITYGGVLMYQEQKFFICKHCGNLVGLINNSGGKLVCCNEAMTELVANSTDAATEKHLPLISVNGNEVTVTIGSVLHPATEEHFINWIYLQTEKGGQRKWLSSDEEPTVTFILSEDDHPIAAFEYCNIHGLWKTNI